MKVFLGAGFGFWSIYINTHLMIRFTSYHMTIPLLSAGAFHITPLYQR